MRDAECPRYKLGLYVKPTVSDWQADFSEADRITTVRGGELELRCGRASGTADSAVSGHELRAHFGTRQVRPRVTDIDESTDGRNRREQKGGERYFAHEQEPRPRGREGLGRSSSQREMESSRNTGIAVMDCRGRGMAVHLPFGMDGLLCHSSLTALCRWFITPFARGECTTTDCFLSCSVSMPGPDRWSCASQHTTVLDSVL